MNAQSPGIMCLFGQHHWKSIYRVHVKPIMRQHYELLVDPRLPFPIPFGTGMRYMETEQRIGDRCTLCGKRRAV